MPGRTLKGRRAGAIPTMPSAVPMIVRCALGQRGQVPRWVCEVCGEIKPEGRADALCSPCRAERTLLDWINRGGTHGA